MDEETSVWLITNHNELIMLFYNKRKSEKIQTEKFFFLRNLIFFFRDF